jgi:putative ABC transport system permease protein
MRRLRALLIRLTGLFRRKSAEQDLTAEVESHLEMHIEDNIRAGMSFEEARRDALKRLGGIHLAKEVYRDRRSLPMLETLLQDLRYAFRTLRDKPGFTFVAVATLALGIGANTAIFSAINAVLLRPLPYKNPDRLAMLWMDNRRLGLHEDLTSYPNYEDWKKSTVFEDMAGFVPGDAIITSLEEPARVITAYVNWNFFGVLGVAPAMGRTFTSDEDLPNKDQVVVLSDGLWKRQFGSDPHVLDKTIEFNGTRYRIIGVMPASFAFPSKNTQLWKTLAMTPRGRGNRGGFFLSVIGRLKPGVTIERARAEMSGIGKRLEAQYPNTNRGYGVWVVPLLAQTVGSMRQVLLVLLGAVAFVLLIACANVANLLLGRGAARGREIAVRAALGAGRRRIVRQLLTESALLSSIAGVCGLAIAFGGMRGLVLLAPKDLPRISEIMIDGRVLIFTAAVSLLAAILFGMAPAWRVSGVDLNDALREGGRSLAGGLRSRFVRSGITIAEVCFSMILLSGAGLMIRTLLNLRSVNPGFQTGNILTWRIAPSRAKFTQPPQVAAFYKDVLERLRSIPAVQSAAVISDVFLSITPNSGNFAVEGKPTPPPEQQIEATTDAISANYFQTMRVRLIKGRFFDARDGTGTTPVVLINETMARRTWPGENPVGKRFKWGGPDSTAPWMTVVGVVADTRRQGIDKLARCETFSPLEQMPTRRKTLVVRTSSDPLKLAGLIRSEVRAVDKDTVLFELSTIADQIGDSLAQRRFETLLLGLFALVALALAAIGIYGVVFQSVSQRINEIGIRIALGAQKSDLLRMVIGEVFTLVLTGALLGVGAALALTRALSTVLYSVTATDPLTYIVMFLLLASVAALAGLIPARRAATVDPIHALRYE